MKPKQQFKPHEVEVEQDWLFSFGYGHAHPQKYVRIHGTHNSARDEMFRRHGAKWAFQYAGTAKQERELNRNFMTELKE